MSISITPEAAVEVKKIMEAQNIASTTGLRIDILGGGCSGLRYSLGFDEKYDPLIDARHETQGLFVVTRKEFDLFLGGTEVTFLDSDMSRGFQINNPEYPAGMGCAGCGH